MIERTLERLITGDYVSVDEIVESLEYDVAAIIEDKDSEIGEVQAALKEWEQRFEERRVRGVLAEAFEVDPYSEQVQRALFDLEMIDKPGSTVSEHCWCAW